MKGNLAIICIVLSLAITTANSVATPAAAKNSGAVPLIPIATGNAQLDKNIQHFYSCIKKTGHTGGNNPEPSRDEVNSCYFQVFTSNSNISHVHGHRHKSSTQGESIVGSIPDSSAHGGNSFVR
jgi:hypothetical protein